MADIVSQENFLNLKGDLTIILLLGSPGDVIACEPILRFLVQINPNGTRGWITHPENFEALLTHPALDYLIAANHAEDAYAFLRRLPKTVRIIDLHLYEDARFSVNFSPIYNKNNRFLKYADQLRYGSVLEAATAAAGLPVLCAAPQIHLPAETKNVVSAKSYVVVSKKATHLKDDAIWAEFTDALMAQSVCVVQLGDGSAVSEPNTLYHDLRSLTSFQTIAAVLRGASFFVGSHETHAHLANAFGVDGVVVLDAPLEGAFHSPFCGPYAAGEKLMWRHNDQTDRFSVAELIALYSKRSGKRLKLDSKIKISRNLLSQRMFKIKRSSKADIILRNEALGNKSFITRHLFRMLLSSRFLGAKSRSIALRLCERYVEPTPKNAGIYLKLGKMLADAGDDVNAAIALSVASRLGFGPEPGEILSRLAATNTPYERIEDALKAHFDPAFYGRENGDVRDAGHDLLIHYLLNGWKENRNPSEVFNAEMYVENYGSLMDDGQFPLVHYHEFGLKNGFHADFLKRLSWLDDDPQDIDWSTVPPAKHDDRTEVVVILPVYKGRTETLRCVLHALLAKGERRYSLFVINDCSPDARLSADLETLNAKGLFDYARNEKNLGFVKTINRAIGETPAGKDVILLNSDAFVFPGWADRLLAHAANDPEAATITPLSNNATLCSYPSMTFQDNSAVLECDAASLDELAARTNAGIAVETPTGVGFCFFMRRSVIDQIGAFDENAFEIGYGEETDFCRRAEYAGYKNLLACDIFVHHIGSVSFSFRKNAFEERAQRILTAKHPTFHSRVRIFFDVDPAKRARARLDVARLKKPLDGGALFITHALGGGIETAVRQTRKRFMAEGRPVAVVRVHDGHLFSLDHSLTFPPLFTPNMRSIDLIAQWDVFDLLLKDVDWSLLHVDSLVGLDWETQEKVLNRLADGRVPYTYVVHDFSCVSHYYDLLSPQRLYKGIPGVDQLRQWDMERGTPAPVGACAPERRLDAYARFFAAARSVEAPSRSAAAIVASFLPDATLSVVPHDDLLTDVAPVSRRPADGEIRVAVLGAIGENKGFYLLKALGDDSRERGLRLNYFLIGFSSSDELLKSSCVNVLGRYKTEAEAVDRLRSLQPDFIFISSIVSETFCYTLSIALKCRIPTVVFDIGAQAERTRAINWSVALPIERAVDARSVSDAFLALDLDDLWERASA